jgi:GNAT superfamily N-acetyltransferase
MIKIRALLPDEANSVKQFLQNVWNELFGSNPDPYIRNYFSYPETLKDLDDITRTYFDNNGAFLVAVSDNIIVATGAVIRIDAEICEMCRMFVHTEYRRQGIAMSLSNSLLDFAKLKGYKKMKLGSNRELTASHLLYRKLGFKEVQPQSAKDGEYAIFMERDIS